MELHFASVVAKIRENINCESRLGKEPAGSRLGSQGPWSMAGAPRCLGSVQDGRSLTLRQTSSGSSCQDNDRSVCDWPTLISLQVPKEPATPGLSGPQVWGRLTSQGRLPLPCFLGSIFSRRFAVWHANAICPAGHTLFLLRETEERIPPPCPQK